ALVREVGQERAVLYRNAPHLVIPERMLLPLIEGGSFSKFMSRIGLTIYDVFASVKPGERKKMLSKEETLAVEPGLNSEVLLGGALYSEYRTDDARLTLEVIKTACNMGAAAVNYLKFTDFIKEDGLIVGIKAEDTFNKQTLTIKAKQVINAAGPWVDKIRDKDGAVDGRKLHHTKGVHIVIPRGKLPIHQSIYFDVGDGRMIFAIPRGPATYIGTTDTDYTGDLNVMRATLDEVNYLLTGVEKMFPKINLKQEDIISSYAGIRPLIHQEGKAPGEISRRDEIFVTDSNLLSIAGGKLTGYRKMAKKVTDMALQRLANEFNYKDISCQTRFVVLQGGDIKDMASFKKDLRDSLKKLGMDEDSEFYLTHTYGSQAWKILTEVEGADKEIALGLVEVGFAIRNESMHTLQDFFIRRTGKLFFDPLSILKLLEPVSIKAAELLGWDDQRRENEVQEIKTLLKEVVEFK
ncbi:MAG: glycerol-3-phosphate dehydrogenase/oxidase, partial [Flavobacteriales bacterium]|nr:glycerol-3-phosphate dehydrogenase/oxidase [Flavobacteriales bacterium]